MTSTKNKISEKARLRNSQVTGSIVAFIIAISPFIFYTYTSFPNTKTWETFLFTFTSEYYSNVYIFSWFLLGKFVPFLLLTIWFLTCRHWWKPVILIPMIMYVFQMITVLNDDLRYVDEVELWFLFPIIVILVPLVYLVRIKFFSELTSPDLAEIEKELGRKRSFWQQFKELFY